MALGFIITVIIVIVLIVIAFKILKSILKAIMFVAVIMLIALAVTGFFVYQDFQDFQSNFVTGGKQLLFTENDVIIAGFSTTDFSESSTEYYTEEEIADFNQDYLKEEYDRILGTNFKTFYVDKEIVIGEIVMDNITITEEVYRLLLASDDPSQVLTDHLEGEGQFDDVPEFGREDAKEEYKQGLEEELGTGGEAKSKLLAIGFAQKMDEGGMGFLIKEIKEGNITLYPKTIIIKMIRYIPSSILERAGGE
jgi:energy-coupling factor transporter transmembrane protein EcfT